MEGKPLVDLSACLEEAASHVSHSGTTGGARVQLQLVQTAEKLLGHEHTGENLKEVGHSIMTALLKILEHPSPGPVCSCRAKFALHVTRLEHHWTEILTVQNKKYIFRCGQRFCAASVSFSGLILYEHR
jgi:hypothetical protein